MSESTMRCPQGHENPAGQLFCGSCGTSLEGLCPNGHSNPAGQHFCGQCGAALTANPAEAPQPLATGLQVLENDPPAAEPADSSNEAGMPDGPPILVGATFTSSDGLQATIARISGEDVWVDARKGSTDYGSFKFTRAEVVRRLRVAEYMKSAPTVDVGTQLMLRNGYHATVAKVAGDDVWLDVEQDGRGLGQFKFPFGDVALAISENQPVVGSGIPDHGVNDDTAARTAASPISQVQNATQPESTRVIVGASFTTGSGEHAVIRGVTGDDVWVEIRDTNGANLGTLRFPMAAVETALNQQSQKQAAEPLWRAAMRERAERTAGTGAPPPPPAHCPPPSWTPPSVSTPDTNSSEGNHGQTITRGAARFWAGLSPMGRAALIGVPVVIAIAIWVISANAVDERSYRAGRELSTVSTAGYKVGCAMGFCAPKGDMTPESQCRHWIKHDYGEDVSSQGFVLKDMVAGCLAGFGD